MTKPVLHKLRLKRKAWIKYKIAQTASDYLQLSLQKQLACRNEVTEATKESKHCFEKKIAKDISNNLKHFWKYVNSKTKVKSGKMALLITNCDSEMANI